MTTRVRCQRWAFLGVVLASLAASGCATHTGTGALAGGGLGAATGALIGSASGNAGKGAALGAAIGAMGGGLLGAAKDEHEQQVAAAQARNAMSIQEIIEMSRGGVSDDLICRQIATSGTVFQLTSADLAYLTNQGVSDRVIAAMQDTRRRPVVIRRRPVYVEPAPIVVVEPAPPPPVVGFGFSYSNRR